MLVACRRSDKFLHVTENVHQSVLKIHSVVPRHFCFDNLSALINLNNCLIKLRNVSLLHLWGYLLCNILVPLNHTQRQKYILQLSITHPKLRVLNKNIVFKLKQKLQFLFIVYYFHILLSFFFSKSFDKKATSGNTKHFKLFQDFFQQCYRWLMFFELFHIQPVSNLLFFWIYFILSLSIFK